MLRTQTVTISGHATAFTAICDLCVELDSIAGWSGSTFGGRLDLDCRHGMFLCRRGHSIRVERELEHTSGRDRGSAAA